MNKIKELLKKFVSYLDFKEMSLVGKYIFFGIVIYLIVGFIGRFFV